MWPTILIQEKITEHTGYRVAKRKSNPTLKDDNWMLKD